ncbi:hypothetical protein TSUD_119580 [Trifolium subterraneum]|uniref:Uncharacterized protein n=1 Tax=Trifolium subterraneum TaxID=3900 RepID=A0A2Z6P797_TRISU|nr:hypothetical protein TSUD_119580 [Trifolium subterraneum]
MGGSFQQSMCRCQKTEVTTDHGTKLVTPTKLEARWCGGSSISHHTIKFGFYIGIKGGFRLLAVGVAERKG